ncbi:hypothetical protein L198_04363 [Cryptococcus wingfieldii CBS 7118]|uniref:Velvet domain-containing protein n=2 Tax=Cryptococcus TaxID=5206 RepID=A0A1E3J527_9TREE|nr:hypothetical protein L198_04363 [Cryptococcus wingfieldii CBS 7118]ODN95745.1 hypothetical protein L198_04363 [Cryptococcus wingfieldii CBS 7118]TYJ51951.1 hypothetical protein B9479_007465 [Cryptococcus floricola]
MVLAPTGQAVQMLYGTLVAAPAEMDDMTGGEGVYFVFPDVSVRFVGRFRLKAMLMRITGGPAINVCVTPTFEIVHNRDYIAPPLTPLTRHFNNQNVVRFGLPRWS